MLISSILRPFSLVPCALLVSNTSAFSHPWSKRADDLKVEFPEGGESYTTGIDIDIAWTPSSGDNARLELKKGAVDRLSTVHVITSETQNNGTYQWRSREDGFLKALISKDLPSAPPSACDYVISVRVEKTTVHSGYFTIINVNDNGLPDDAQCPDVKVPPPTGGGSSPSGTNEDDKKEDEGSKEEDNSSGDGESSSSNDSNSGTVTTAMLGGAVGGAAGGLLLIFSAILLLGRSRGWFVDDEYIEKRVSAAVINIVQGNENVKNRLVQEVTQALEIGSQPIHQLEA